MSYPPPSNNHHQEYSIFRIGNPNLNLHLWLQLQGWIFPGPTHHLSWNRPPRRVITECRALIDMSPLERQEAFEKLRKAWPQGPTYVCINTVHTHIYIHIFYDFLMQYASIYYFGGWGGGVCFVGWGVVWLGKLHIYYIIKLSETKECLKMMVPIFSLGEPCKLQL